MATSNRNASAITESPVNSKLDAKLDAKLVAYMAAGLGTLSLTQSAQAKIVYTPANTTLTSAHVVLDVNNDGVSDFSFSQFAYGHWDHFYVSPLVKGNAVLENGDPAALRAGVPIGPKGQFGSMAFQILAKFGSTSGIPESSGNWDQVATRYLGLRFLINGQTHYGWARITVTGTAGYGATLTGYAYETIPNKRILAGQTSGAASADGSAAKPSSPPALQPVSLGLLARGADTLALWRREDATTPL